MSNLRSSHLIIRCFTKPKDEDFSFYYPCHNNLEKSYKINILLVKLRKASPYSTKPAIQLLLNDYAQGLVTTFVIPGIY